MTIHARHWGYNILAILLNVSSKRDSQRLKNSVDEENLLVIKILQV